MRWEKLGQRYAPDGAEPWARTHASTPWGVWLPDGNLRVYHTSRDDSHRSHIVWVDLDAAQSFNVVRRADAPTLTPGEPGLFDDSGVAMACLVQTDEIELLYYLGWNLKVTVPWCNTVGLAVRRPGEPAFVKRSRVPLLDRSEEDPYSLSYPTVLVEDGTITMWYGTNDGWGSTEDSMAHAIGRATSTDGLTWVRDRERALSPRMPIEYALARPFVRRTDSGYDMFYSYRASQTSSLYRIGWAVSRYGITWDRRDDQVGIGVSADGWDSEMVCYAFVFDHDGATYMLYNGNGYGATGFGLARLQAD